MDVPTHPTASRRGIALREAGIQSLLLAVLLAAAFPGVFFRGDVASPGDLLFLTRPWSEYAPEGWQGPINPLMPDMPTEQYPNFAVTAKAVKAGEWPLWNPHELAGIPLHAAYQSAVLYPPRILHTLLGIPWGATAYILLKLYLCGIVAYACGRGLGLGIPAARFYSVAWMLSGHNLLWCYWPLPDVSAWTPLLLLGVEDLCRGRSRRGMIVLSLGATLTLYGGHPESAFVLGFGTGLYFLARMAMQRPGLGILARRSALALAAWTVAILASAAILLPFLEYMVNSYTFQEKVFHQETYWMPLTSAAAFWVPRFFGTFAEGNFWGELDSTRYSTLYPGLAVWFGLAVLLPLALKKRIWLPQAVPLTLSAGFCLLVAFQCPPFSLIEKLPPFHSMRICYFTQFPLVALPLLAAMGVDGWFTARQPMRRLLWLVPCIVAVVLFLTAVWKFNSGLISALQMDGYIRFQLVVALVLGLVSLVPFVVATRAIWHRLLPAILTVIVAADLLFAARGLNPVIPPAWVAPETAFTRYLQDQPRPCRVGVGEANIASGLMAVYGISEWLGYGGIYPARIVRFQKHLGERVWDAIEPACAIQFYAHDPRYQPLFPIEEPGRFELAATLDGLELYRNLRALPHARLVPAVEQVPDESRMLERLANPGLDPSATVLSLTAPSYDPAPDALAEGPGEARVTRYQTTRVDVEVDARHAAMLVLADAWFPGWRAEIDGQPARVHDAYYVFRGVMVPSGSHTVVFRYDPWTFRVGLAISTGTLLLALFGGVLFFARFRRVLA
jgi:hypothetical protein